LTHSYHRLHRAYLAWRDSPGDDTLHEVRIALKKFRYTCEAFRDVYGRRMEEAIRILKDAQEHIGTWNDTRVARDYVRAYKPLAKPNLHDPIMALATHLDEKAVCALQAFEAYGLDHFAKHRRKALLQLIKKPKKPCC
jgi:CHAD domain-containing protein